MSKGSEPVADVAQASEPAQGCAIHETFRSWPHVTPSIQSMINAGFVMMENTYDRVQCLCCQLKICNWDPEEDPLDVHVQRSTDCGVANAMEKYAEKRQEAELVNTRSTVPIHTAVAKGPSSSATSASSAAARFTPTPSTVVPESSSATKDYRLLHFIKNRKGAHEWHLTRSASKGMPLDASRADLSNAYNPFHKLEQGFHAGVLEAITEVVGENGPMYGWQVYAIGAQYKNTMGVENADVIVVKEKVDGNGDPS
ncbi:MAG: hypothetical protein Q9174_002505 [Haloplaca sp. 1 TL-2023]